MEDAIKLDDNWVEPSASSQGQILYRYIFKILPRVKKELKYWEYQAHMMKNETLKIQALSSLKNKAFHCHGGAVYALNNYGKSDLVELIVAYQTICDYLDNLCDRAGVTEEKAFFTLHQALLDALNPKGNYNDYYCDYAFKDDSAYLLKLVKTCNRIVQQLPSYELVYKDIVYLTNLYINLQVKKHIDWSQREEVLIKWAEEESRDYPFIKWQEFAAASGSTLAVFALFSLASQENLKALIVRDTVNAHFPWICGLHILLDYVIDQDEDRRGGDLNFTFYYEDDREMQERLNLFTSQAKINAQKLPPENFHLTVVQGLLAMYLSDPKVEVGKKGQIRSTMMQAMGANTVKVYHLCKIVRKVMRL